MDMVVELINSVDYLLVGTYRRLPLTDSYECMCSVEGTPRTQLLVIMIKRPIEHIKSRTGASDKKFCNRVAPAP